MRNTSVVLAEDHGIVRAGLKALLDKQANLTVIGEAEDGQAVLDLVAALKPDIVLLDLSMPRLSGLEACRQIKLKHPDTKVIALTVHEECAHLTQLLSAGADGYILKRSAAMQLLQAIEAVMSGASVVDAELACSMAKQLSMPGSLKDIRPASLSDREVEVMKLVVQGFSTKEISNSLGISGRTIDAHKSHSMEKLQFSSRSELIRYALAQGWLQTSAGCLQLDISGGSLATK